MKNLLLTCSLSLIACFAFAQKANVVLFTENGERFTVILNGASQNAAPETQVKITDLTAEFYKLKVIFADPALGSLDKNLPLQHGSEVAYSIKKNNKGEYVLRFVSETPLAQVPTPPATQTVIVYNANPAPAGTSVVQQTTTTTTGGNSQQDHVNMGMSVNDPELGVNFNFNMSAGGPGNTQTQTHTQTTTTTSSTQVQNAQPQAVQVVYLPGYGGPVGCPHPMTPGDFGNVKTSIKSKSFDESRLTIAKQVINNNCLLSSQVKEIMLLFSFEDTRLDLAKYAYGYTYDIGNYYQLNDAFTFESSIDELNDHINKR